MWSLFFTGERTYLEWLNDVYWWPVILCVLIILVGLYFIFLYNPKPKTSELTENEVLAIINLFGSVDNILSVSKNGSRFKVEVNKVENCNLEGMKDLGCTGIFVTGSQVKLIFPFDANAFLERFN